MTPSNGKITFRKGKTLGKYTGEVYYHWNILLDGKSIRNAYIMEERYDVYYGFARYVYIPVYNKKEIVERGIHSLHTAKVFLVDYVNKHHNI